MSEMTGSDTIYAVSSGAGMAGIAVVRISGDTAGQLLDSIAGKRPKPRVATVRLLRDPSSGEAIDRALVLWMPGPNSSTGEDVAELHVHGSLAVVNDLFTAFQRIAGVRPAEAGEFTRRAFANRRMDLVEIEGLADLLKARTTAQRKQAVHHFLGDASLVYETWRNSLTGILAHVEAAVDFAEEDSAVTSAVVAVSRATQALSNSMTSALATAGRGEAIRDGVKVVLTGRPNTGKSSLLNAMVKRDAAIVSPRPGTTRDVIQVMMDLDGMPVILTDTAGLRSGVRDEVEALGIGRAWRELNGADMVIWVSSPDIPGSDAVDVGLLADLHLYNKCDLPGRPSDPSRNDMLSVSAKSGEGIDQMLSVLASVTRERYGLSDSAVIVRARHKQAVEESIRHLNGSLRHGADHPELIAEDLRKAAFSLARVTGRIGVEDLLTAIFAEFCIGK